MVYCATGHRPERVGGYNSQIQDSLYLFAVDVLKRYNPENIIVGMAQGWDTAIAKASLSLKIPYIAAVPYRGQGENWDFASQSEYKYLLDNAKSVVVLSEFYERNVFEKRDKWMVDNSESVIALFDGITKGGTYLTVNYANSIGKPVLNQWNDWILYKDENEKRRNTSSPKRNRKIL